MRYIVVGTSGSGKSVFAAALARRLNCPHHELDAYFWAAGQPRYAAEGFPVARIHHLVVRDHFREEQKALRRAARGSAVPSPALDRAHAPVARRRLSRRRGEDDLKLVWPSAEYLPAYVAALERGWSPNNVRGKAAADEELAQIAADSSGFLSSLVDREARGEPITMPDGSQVPRLPGFRKWMWDGEFCGSIGLRWQPGTEALPSYCLGHIGYAVVPWKQRQGCATRALRDLLPEAAGIGLRYVEITTEPENEPSRRVIEANGGVLVEHFTQPAQYGGTPAVRYRIPLV